jgi:hypothetical protein
MTVALSPEAVLMATAKKVKTTVVTIARAVIKICLHY